MFHYFKVMYKISYACKYFHYLLTSGHSKGYGVHSPFVYDFITRVLNGPDIADYKHIEKLMEELSNDFSELYILDMGAGSSSGSGKIRTPASIVKLTSIPPKYGRLLARLVGWLLPSTIIELGTGAAISTMYMAITDEKCRIFSIEGCPETGRLAQQNIAKLNLRNIEIITGSFNEILPSILQKIHHDLLVFIDGDHRGDRLISYVESILPCTNENTVIVLDDIRWSRSMEKAWKNIIWRKEISLSIDLFRMGILLPKRNMFKQHYVIKY
ncbi:MAG: hypothetical protein AMS27_12730 [Bacteroides sp. SM23_62_1]|nr:MAG: hypothetical protein AMS27_12730 [Bacteroides sp. SM23_62_1]